MKKKYVKTAFFLLLLSVTLCFAEPSVSQLKLWRFIKADVPMGSSTANWAEVIVPHTWNNEDGHNGGSYYRGPGCYQMDLKIKEADRGQRFFLRFEAVGTESEVFLNQKSVGSHLGGYSAFVMEITNQVKGGGVFDLRVRANNAFRRDVAPLSGDFTISGGMHRKAELIVKNPISFSQLNYGSPGVLIYQDRVSAAQADMRVKVLIDNGDSLGKSITTRISLTDHEGKAVAEKSFETAVPAGEVLEVEKTLNVLSPHLWHGIKDPYLYHLKVELFVGKIRVDEYVERVGFRYYHIDAERGFYLNGEPYPLRGVNIHQDRAVVGAAVSDEQILEDFKYIKEIGANCLRLAHYPHSTLSYEQCDELGLLAWAEIPLVNSINHDPGFAPNARQQLLEMIRQHGNHSSIFTWSISNEIFQTKTDDPFALLTELNEIAKKEDPTRTTILATNHRRGDLCNLTDRFAINNYPGWYNKNVYSLLETLKNYNETGKNRGVAVSEYGAGGAPTHQDQTLEYVVPNGKWHPEQWQAFLHEKQYMDITHAPECWGSFVWAMFDFSSDTRKEGAMLGVNDKGLMTHDRQIKKDAFYFYKANWSHDPVLHLTSKRHLVRNNPETLIKVYSNADVVNLSVNGKSFENRTPDGFKIALWEKVELQVGKNQIVVTAGGLHDEITWDYDPAADSSNSLRREAEGEMVEGLYRASDAEKGSNPKFAFDGDVNTRWASSKNEAWLAQELETPSRIEEVSVLWHQGAKRSYRFKIETSMDGNVWRPVYSGTSLKTGDFETYQLKQPDEARYVRVLCSGSDVNAWSSIHEMRLKLEI
jgi:beta-galactosidase